MAKVATLALLGDDLSGIVHLSLENRKVEALKFSRTALTNSIISNKEVWNNQDRSGIYLIIGLDDNEEDTVYVGKSDNIFRRLNQHFVVYNKTDVDKTEYAKIKHWQDTIVFTSVDNSLKETEISYLENRLYTIASEIGRYKTTNMISPTTSHSLEKPFDVATTVRLSEMVEDISIIVELLGYRIFKSFHFSDKLKTAGNALNVGKMVDVLTYKNAKAIDNGVDFVVLKGSYISKRTSDSLKQRNKKVVSAREKVLSANSDGLLTTDVIFKTETAAASFVSGNTESRGKWK